MMSSKFDRLKDYINSINYLATPSEGGEQRVHIGGSELDGLLKTKNIENFVVKRMSNGFSGNIHTRYGNIFEYNSKLYMERNLCTTIVTTRSIPGMLDVEGNIIQSYTPDGISVVDIDKVEGFLSMVGKELNMEHVKNSTQYNEKDVYVLFEFKSPTKRLITDRWNETNIHYKTQVLAGMDTINMCEVGLYVDCSYRICSIGNLYNDNTDYIPIDGQRGKFEKVYDRGMLGFYKRYKDTSTKYDELFDGIKFTDLKDMRTQVTKKYLEELEKGDNSDELLKAFKKRVSSTPDNYYMKGIVDMSNIGTEILNIIFRDVLNDNDNKDKYCLFYSNGDVDHMLNFKKFCRDNNYTACCVLPWKLLDVKCIPVYREDGFLERYRNKIEECYKLSREYATTLATLMNSD
jgi:hypothetical protein